MEIYKDHEKHLTERKHQRDLEHKRELRHVREAKKLEAKKARESMQDSYSQILTDFITSSLHKGLTKSEIKYALEKKGWPKNFVDKYVESFFKCNKKFIKEIRAEHKIEKLDKFAKMEEDIENEIASTADKIAHHHEKYMNKEEELKFKETKVEVEKIEESEAYEKKLQKQISDIDKKLEDLN